MEMDALYAAWCAEHRAGAGRPLKAWLEAYPTYADSILEWASAEPLQEFAESQKVSAEAEERVKALGRAVLAKRRAAMEASLPLISLAQAMKERGFATKSLAKALGVGTDIVAKLQNRLIRAETVPAALLAKMSDALSVSVGQIRAYLSLSPTLSPGAMYKATDAPEAGAAQDFATAIQDSLDMSQEEKRFWLEA